MSLEFDTTTYAVDYKYYIDNLEKQIEHSHKRKYTAI